MLHEKSPQARLDEFGMVVTHVILQLVAARELLSTGGTAEGRLGHPVQGAAELAPALAGVHHVLDLQKTVGDLDMGEVRGVRKVRRVSASGRLGLVVWLYFRVVQLYRGWPGSLGLFLRLHSEEQVGARLGVNTS